MNSNKKNFLIKTSTLLSIATASLILLVKLYAWISTSSSSILATMIDSSLDITSSIINFLAVRFALIPPDNNHRFGHDKVIDLAVLSQGVFFIASGIFVIISSIIKFDKNEVATNLDIGLQAMILSTICTLALVIFQSYVIKVTNATIIKADKLHYLTDLLSNVIVFLSIYFSKEYKFLDSLGAILIAFYLIYGAISLIMGALKNLLDEEFEASEKEVLLSVLGKYQNKGKIYAAHDIKTRKAGNRHFIQLHLELNKELKLYDTHKIVEEIEEELLKHFPEADIIIHQDPAGISEDIKFRDDLNVPK